VVFKSLLQSKVIFSSSKEKKTTFFGGYVALLLYILHSKVRLFRSLILQPKRKATAKSTFKVLSYVKGKRGEKIHFIVT
jgi:hypothetical protein